MKRIYISGQITGLDIEEAKKRFEAAERLMRVQGFDPCNPMKLPHTDQELEWREHLAHDIRDLVFCDAIYMMKGWNHSRGARLELAIAKGLGMELYFEEALDKTYYHYSL